MRTIALVFLLACSKDPTITPDRTDGGEVAPDPGPTKPGETSGSRLKRRVYQGADGSEQFVGWFDSERKEPCGFAPSADGSIRCLPNGSPTSNVFSDSACTTPLATVGAGCAPEATAYSFAPSTTPGPTCGPNGVRRIHQVGARFAGATIFVRGAGSTCTAAPASSYTATDLYLTIGEAPPPSFVLATETQL